MTVMNFPSPVPGVPCSAHLSGMRVLVSSGSQVGLIRLLRSGQSQETVCCRFPTCPGLKTSFIMGYWELKAFSNNLATLL